MVPASLPLTPTARLPCSFMASMSSWFTLPMSTVRTTSIASSVVTRWPSLNSTGSWKRSMASVMAWPPPCTMTGFTPMILSSTMSLMTSARSFSSTMADPPYLMTTVFPVMFLIQGSASTNTSADWVDAPFGRVSLAYFMCGSLH